MEKNQRGKDKLWYRSAKLTHLSSSAHLPLPSGLPSVSVASVTHLQSHAHLFLQPSKSNPNSPSLLVCVLHDTTLNASITLLYL